MKNRNSWSHAFLTLGLAALSPVCAYAADANSTSVGLVGAAGIENPSLSENGSSRTIDGRTSYGGGLPLKEEFQKIFL